MDDVIQVGETDGLSLEQVLVYFRARLPCIARCNRVLLEWRVGARPRLSAIFIFLKELFLILCVANLFHVDDSHFQATPTDIHKLRHTHKHTYGLIPLDG